MVSRRIGLWSIPHGDVLTCYHVIIVFYYNVVFNAHYYQTTAVGNISICSNYFCFLVADYTYAPVLLNARAIVKCKANLSTFSYPVLFLFLENSCMRQIRNIFGLTANDFSHNSPSKQYMVFSYCLVSTVFISFVFCPILFNVIGNFRISHTKMYLEDIGAWVKNGSLGVLNDIVCSARLLLSFRTEVSKLLLLMHDESMT